MSITVNGYDFSGDPIVLTTGNSTTAGALSLGAGITAEFDDNLTTGAINTNGGTLTLTGGGSFASGTGNVGISTNSSGAGTVNITAGTYALTNQTLVGVNGTTNAITVNFTGNSSLTDSANNSLIIGYASIGAVNYNSSATSTVGSGQLVVGRQGTALLTIQQGQITYGNNGAYISNNSSTGNEIDLKGGALVGTSALDINNNSNAGETGTLLVEGGTLTNTSIATQTNASPSTTDVATITMTSGAINTNALNTGAVGTTNVNFSGGVFGNNTAAISTTAKINLGGNVTFRPSLLAGGTSTIALTGTLSGTGGFTENGVGTLTIGNASSVGALANTYSGPTKITAGTLSLFSGGLSSVEVGAGATLQLDLTTALAGTSSLTLDSALTSSLSLSYADNATGIDSIASLTVGGQSATAGTYSASALNTMFATSEFSGTGDLQILGTVAAPEPSTWAYLLLGVAGLVGVSRVRRSNV